MYARVAKWEGVSAERMKDFAEQIANADGPPEGVPSNGVMLLNDPDSGRTLTIALFETEEDLRKGDETLNAMNPPQAEGEGSRVSVEMYEVAAEKRM